MSTRYQPGDIIIVSPNTQWHSGSHVIARVMDGSGAYKATFKVLKITGESPGETYELIPLNDEYDTKIFKHPPDGKWQIVGVVVDMKPNLHGKQGC